MLWNPTCIYLDFFENAPIDPPLTLAVEGPSQFHDISPLILFAKL